MVTRPSRWLLLVVALAAAGCSGSSDAENTGTSAPDTAEQTGSPDEVDDEGSGSVDADPDPTDDEVVTAPSTTDADITTTTEALRPGVVAFEGSIEDVLRGIDDAVNFASGVGDWLAAVPGQEGVLRNSRGVTLFVPVDEGFSEDDRRNAFADPDRSAATIGDHLRVGVLDTLDEPVVVASGREYAVERDGDDTLVDGRRVLRTQVATNGVIHLIDGPLGADPD